MELTMEQIEKVCGYTGVSLELAKQALEETGGSSLDAVILLEKKGWAHEPKGGTWSTRWDAPRGEAEAGSSTGKKNAVMVKAAEKKGGRRRYTAREVADAVESLLRNCTRVTIDVWRGDDLLVGIPLIICVLLFLVAPYAMVPLTIVGLALRCRYHISGWDFGAEAINRTMDQVTETVADWTDQMWDEVQDYRAKHKK